MIVDCDSFPDIKWRFTLHTDATGEQLVGNMTSNAFTGVNDVTGTIALATNGATQIINLGFYCVGGTADGNIALQWAQNNSSALASIVLAGSNLRVYEN